MALLVLIVMGAVVGWLASILARTEETPAILKQVALGLIASLAGGLIVNQGTILGSLSLMALGAGFGLAAGALAIYHAVLNRRADA